MLAVLKWIAFLPVFFASSIAAWLVSPIAPLFAHDYSLKGTWLWWCTTPNTNLLGDPDHRKRWEGRSVYLQQVTWILRNPAVNFQRDYLGYEFTPDDDYFQHHKPLSNGGIWKRETIFRDNRLRCWMIYFLIVYPFKKDKGFRFLIGWKTWDFGAKNPLQMTCRITPWKSV